ncbi:MAG: undecaprenyl-diphosphate phosphatase [Phycisphaerae bacterium]|nr:undecaprenyl-diphosphate phosphatase [Phycisphaerae bacterium]
MDGWLILKAVVIAIVEGLTEFVPVSSTGHMILVDDLLLRFKDTVGGVGPQAAVCFEIVIQLAAILAVVVLYRKRFRSLLTFKRDATGFNGWRGIKLLIVTTIPAVIIGAPLDHLIEEHLFNAGTVAIGLAAGAVAILLIERYRFRPKAETLDDLTWPQALAIGFFQCLAMWPGVSRSAATIIGGMIVRANRKTAAEYSFLAAVPVMTAASGFKLIKSWEYLSGDLLWVFLIGSAVSFVSAMLAVKWFIRLLQHWTLRPFAVYRLVLAAVVGLVFLLRFLNGGQ